MEWPALIARGKWVSVTKHAWDGMNAERPPIQPYDVEATLEEPDQDDGQQALRWIRNRTIIIYYEEHAHEVRIRSVSATTRRLAP